NCDKVVYGISYSKKSGLIASGHSDRVIRIWDPRATDTAIVKLTLSSHKNWVTSISWSTTNSFMLASGSYDGTIKIWDIRSKTPLYTLSKQQSDDKGKEKENIKIKKVFSVDWDNDVILSGGEDNQLHIYGTKKIVPSEETYILHIHASYNNTLVTLTNSRGDILLTKSGGSVGFKKAQRGGYEAAHQTAAGVIQKIKEKGLNVKNVEICIKGFGPGRDAAFKALANVENQWNVKRITDTTPLPFNGCRPRKARRL
ncbi:15626_t:CDS:2, partial [Funneliformis mosseae]